MSIIEHSLRNHSRPYLTDSEMALLLGGSADSRYGKVKRLIAQGKLIHLRRGLYCVSEWVGHSVKPHPFELAQHIYAPSYISLESALAYHNLIPETVYSITSVCTKLPKSFKTPLGVFSYMHLPLKNFYAGVTLIREQDFSFFIATPWKAICDYIYCYKKNWRNAEPLFESLRVNPGDLPVLSLEESELLEEYYHHKRLTLFLKGIQNER